MKRLIKYLILFVAAVVFLEASGSTDISFHNGEEACADYIAEYGFSTTLSETEHDICLPRQISSASHARVQSSSRRTVSTQRHHLEFVKTGRIINAGIRYFIQKNSINIHSSLTDPSENLTRLGRLII